MIEPGQELGLALEAGHAVGIAGEEIGQKLERNLAAQGQVIGEEDFAHASGAELSADFIMTQRLADHEGKLRDIDAQCNIDTQLKSGADCTLVS